MIMKRMMSSRCHARCIDTKRDRKQTNSYEHALQGDRQILIPYQIQRVDERDARLVSWCFANDASIEALFSLSLVFVREERRQTHESRSRSPVMADKGV